MRGTVSSLNIHAPNCIGKQARDLIEVLNKEQPDIILVQEAWDIDLRKFLPDGFATNQITSGTRDKGGVAVVWRKSVFSLVSKDLIFGCTAPAGTEMATRWFSKAVLKNDSNGRIDTFISCHFPARQTAVETGLQKPMATRMIEIYQNRKNNNILIGGDFNFLIDDDPHNISGRSTMIRRGPRIDGFYMHPSLDPSGAYRGDNIYSHHYPVSVKVDI
jgi:exonuclease III